MCCCFFTSKQVLFNNTAGWKPGLEVSILRISILQESSPALKPDGIKFPQKEGRAKPTALQHSAAWGSTIFIIQATKLLAA